MTPVHDNVPLDELAADYWSTLLDESDPWTAYEIRQRIERRVGSEHGAEIISSMKRTREILGMNVEVSS